MNRSQTAFVRCLPVALILACALPGCSTVETQSYQASRDAPVDSAQISTGADFSKYDSLLAEDMGIYFPQGSYTSAEDMAKIRKIFREAFLTELQGYRIVQAPGPGTMAVQAALIDMRTAVGGQLPAMRSDIREIAVPGSIVFLMEMKDSQSGTILARAADKAITPTLAGSSGVETDWGSVQEAAQKWAILFRQFLDNNLGR